LVRRTTQPARASPPPVSIGECQKQADRFKALFSGTFDAWETCGPLRRGRPGHTLIHVARPAVRAQDPRDRAAELVTAGQITTLSMQYLADVLELEPPDVGREPVPAIAATVGGHVHLLYLACFVEWGVALARHTGPDCYWHVLVRRLTAEGLLEVEGHRVLYRRGGEPRPPPVVVECPDEQEFFRLARTPWQPPPLRRCKSMGNWRVGMKAGYVPEFFLMPGPAAASDASDVPARTESRYTNPPRAADAGGGIERSSTMTLIDTPTAGPPAATTPHAGTPPPEVLGAEALVDWARNGTKLEGVLQELEALLQEERDRTKYLYQLRERIAFTAAKVATFRKATEGNPGLMHRLDEQVYDHTLRRLLKGVPLEALRRHGAGDGKIRVTVISKRQGRYAIDGGASYIETNADGHIEISIEGGRWRFFDDEAVGEIRRAVGIPPEAAAAAGGGSPEVPAEPEPGDEGGATGGSNGGDGGDAPAPPKKRKLSGAQRRKLKRQQQLSKSHYGEWLGAVNVHLVRPVRPGDEQEPRWRRMYEAGMSPVQALASADADLHEVRLPDGRLRIEAVPADFANSPFVTSLFGLGGQPRAAAAAVQ
jgi:hypothetical protein